MGVRSIDARTARWFLIHRHLLAPPRSLPASLDQVLAVVRRLGSLQFDPLEAPGARNHELVLHARIGGYRRGWCERLLYPEGTSRSLYEVYNKALNIVPIEELPEHRFAWDRARHRHDAGLFSTHAELVASVLEGVRRGGEVSTRSVTREHGRSLRWYWSPTSEGRAVLEALFETGQLAVSRREGNLRRYDLVERLFPAELLARRVTREDSLRHRLLSRHRAVGLLGQHGAPEVFSGTGTAGERSASLRALLDDGTLTPVRVEGLRRERYVLTRELGVLEGARAPAPAVTFLGPLDPLVWDRRLLSELFGFEYLWEVYTPERRRAFGYYVLPVLFGARLVGRVEPRVSGEPRALTLAGLWLEKGFSVEAPGFAPAFVRALEAYRIFVGAERIVWPRTRLARALREAHRKA